ncbi:hypothetical protein F5Y13DRAFT_190650 [Hypoxylon sp. FL1857]|nr:hypothetical protein F5Y13DRAFT_190650 [Hypoxylon sp. FL1857]
MFIRIIDPWPFTWRVQEFSPVVAKHDTLKNYEPHYANFPNLRRLFIEARSDDEEREVSRRAFYNAVLFMGSVAVFSLVAQKMNASK